ncbi:MAG: bifunctional phosphoribosyl-AMP cyclohydrolase/phosphoribosyl-ATP diphosphatase HisIE [Chloroflexi bacterium]|nr:bifunctional phosphoribosyl-AMP cyclohydrolase/phosphoribosyl-ATP diphosphatase HisIE [Chloroflexota bacterium]
MLKLDERGLMPAIVQDATTKEVLMLGYVNPGSLKRTLKGGQVWFYSRSRQDLWHKGEVSGHYLNLKEARVDCDGDSLLFLVEPTGPACHTGNRTCFFSELEPSPRFEREERGPGALEELFAVIRDRQQEMPQGSYTAQLLAKGVGQVAKKVIEEAGEAALAATQGKQKEATAELADLFYHSLVLMAAAGINPEDVWQELRSRRK